MPFGKFRGFPVEELPDNYLVWVRDNVELREPLRTAIEREWAARFDESEDNDSALAQTADLDARERELLRELITAGYRMLALKLHPDMGGSVEDMRVLNALVEKLRRGVLAA